MYVEAREQELYQYSARQRRGMEETTHNTERDQSAEDFYIEGSEELDFS